LCDPFQKQERNAMTAETQNPPRKPYAAPQLLIYGDIREITKHSGMGSGDGGMGKDNNATGT
jgi:hypothetical protein